MTANKDHILDIPQVSPEENDILISPFTETKVRDAVFQMEHNKALGPVETIYGSENRCVAMNSFEIQN